MYHFCCHKNKQNWTRQSWTFKHQHVDPSMNVISLSLAFWHFLVPCIPLHIVGFVGGLRYSLGAETLCSLRCFPECRQPGPLSLCWTSRVRSIKAPLQRKGPVRVQAARDHFISLGPCFQGNIVFQEGDIFIRPVVKLWSEQTWLLYVGTFILLFT